MTAAGDTLAHLEGLWENAERTQPQTGDTYIRRAVRDEISYEVGVAERPILARDYRVLERAKPKRPEWEAVVASHVRDLEHTREVYARTPGRVDDWESPTRYAKHDELVDPVPLVEMPSREEVIGALDAGLNAWRRTGEPIDRDDFLADAVLELLGGERKA